MTAAVTLDDVSCVFGRGSGAVRAVDGISLAIEPGEFFTLLGPSGSGKTTCLRMIGGFTLPTSGRILIGGEDVSRRPPYARPVNTVFQDYALFPHMSIRDNVGYALMLRKVAKAEREQRTDEMLALVRLPGVGLRRPSELSGGQRQRVALARALISRPQVLLLDEPLGALDLKLREQMQVELKALQRQLGITFLFITHDQHEALSMSDRIGVVNNGRLEQVGTPREVYTEPANAFVARFVGRVNELPAVVVDGAVDVAGVRLEVLGLAGVETGTAITVMSRPEDVRVRRMGNGDASAGALGATVVSEHFAGSSSLLRVRLDRLDILVDAQVDPEAGACTAGDRVNLVLRPDKVHVVASE